MVLMMGLDHKSTKPNMPFFPHRGENVVSMTVEGPPQSGNTPRIPMAGVMPPSGQRGMGAPAGRGVTPGAAPHGLGGPVPGVGGPPGAMMGHGGMGRGGRY